MSSYTKIKNLPIAPNAVRDFIQSYAESANKTVDLVTEFLVCGLDIFVHNRGASSLTIKIDENAVITVC